MGQGCVLGNTQGEVLMSRRIESPAVPRHQICISSQKRRGILGPHLDSGLAEACVPGQALSGPNVGVLIPPKGCLQLLQLCGTEGGAVAASGVWATPLSSMGGQPWSPHSYTREAPVGPRAGV